MAVMLLKSTRFMYPQARDAPIFLDLRRIHNLDTPPGGRNGKKFVVSKRILAEKSQVNKAFGTVNEAHMYWAYEAIRMEDLGMEKMNFKIDGFHEED